MTQPPPKADQAAAQRATRGADQTHAASSAAKPAVVLIHGFWCTERNLARVAQLLEQRGYACHLIRLPGRTPGLPSGHPEVATLGFADYVAAAEQQIAALNLAQPPILLGHSLGGLVAQHLAARNTLHALVLLTPAAPGNVFGLTWRGIRVFWRKLMTWGFWRKPHRLSADQAARYGANGLPAEQQRKIGETLVDDSGRVLFQIACAPLDSDHAIRLDPARVTCPVWMLAAKDDWLTPASVVRKTAALYPQAVLQEDADRGHWVIDDARTPATIDAVCAWLETLPIAAARAT